jgi:hypothetical protein
MRVPPQVSDRIKEAPAQALRGVFAGIGQLLLITDKLRNKTPAQAPPARAPQPSAPRPDPDPPVPTADEVTKARDTDQTGNVRLLTSEEAGSGSTAPAVDATATVSEDAAAAGEAAAAGAAAAAGEAAAAEQAAPVTDAEPGAPVTDAEPGAPVTDAEPGVPLPNYDELPIASLRARLRNLDAAQVKQLAEYERAHAARADVIAMFERRMAKLEAGD